MMISSSRTFLFHSLCFVIIGILTYFPSFSAQLFWDDTDFILQNAYVKELRIDKFFTAQAVEGAGKASNYFRPVQFSMYAVVYKLFGPNAFAFHTVSIGTHIATTVALYYFLLTVFSLFGLRRLSPHQLPFLTSLLFLIHPVQTEAVTYVSGISDPLVALFGFTSMALFLRYVSQQSVYYLLCSLFCFVFALLSKESGVVFFGILFLLWFVAYVTRQRNHQRPLLVSLALYSMVLCVYLLYHRFFIDTIHMGTVFGDSPYTHSVFVRLATFLSIFPQYIQILIFPNVLFYDRDFSVQILKTPWHLPSFIVLFSILTIGIILMVNAFKKTSASPFPPSLLLITFLFFLIAFIPFSGLVLINGIMYEHFLYLALPFFFLFIFLIIQYFSHTILSLRSLCLLCSVFCFLLIARSWSRQLDWQTPIGFYTQTLQHVPSSFRVLNNLGLEYIAQGNDDLAIETFHQAIAYNPSLPNPLHNIGTIYLRQQNYPKAEEYFYKALSSDPNFGYSYSSLITLYEQTGDKEKLQKVSEEIIKRFK